MTLKEFRSICGKSGVGVDGRRSSQDGVSAKRRKGKRRFRRQLVSGMSTLSCHLSLPILLGTLLASWDGAGIGRSEVSTARPLAAVPVTSSLTLSFAFPLFPSSYLDKCDAELEVVAGDSVVLKKGTNSRFLFATEDSPAWKLDGGRSDSAGGRGSGQFDFVVGADRKFDLQFVEPVLDSCAADPQSAGVPHEGAEYARQ